MSMMHFIHKILTNIFAPFLISILILIVME